jgi:CRP/FNR family transcriptional regulator
MNDVYAAFTAAKNNSFQIQQFFSPDNFNKLEDIMYPSSVAAGSHLFWEGDQAIKFYYIKKGQVKITKSTEDGKELILSILQKGDFYGEYGGYGELTFTFNGEVLKDTQVGIVQIKDLEILIYQYGEFAVDFIRWMGLMQRTTQSKFRDLLMFGKSGALASTLIRLTNTYGEATNTGILIKIKLTNTDLANLIGTTRESVNRLLAEFKKAGSIEVDNSYITVTDLAYLRSILSCPNCPAEICRI